jgi:hypothetical protein
MPILRRNVLIPELSVPIPVAESSNVTVTPLFIPTPLKPVLILGLALTNALMTQAFIMLNAIVRLITSPATTKISKAWGKHVYKMV